MSSPGDSLAPDPDDLSYVSFLVCIDSSMLPNTGVSPSSPVQSLAYNLVQDELVAAFEAREQKQKQDRLAKALGVIL